MFACACMHVCALVQRRHLILTEALGLSLPTYLTLGRLQTCSESSFHCLGTQDDDTCPHRGRVSSAFYMQHRERGQGGEAVLTLLTYSLGAFANLHTQATWAP